MGYSQATSHGEMQWLRLYTQPIFISHQIYIYKRCLTSFICCGCAYGCVPTTLWLLMPTNILEFCQKSGLLPGDKWWWNAVLEAVHPTYSSHINVIYIKGVWQPLYAVDVHMDVSPPRYGCSCRPSFWNFARNMGDSQAISHGEMQWLRLYAEPIFISHQCYIYKRCLTTFICCGCAYGCVPTTLWSLMPT
jgi:hypothetical protein